MARVGAEYGRGETVRWTARHVFLRQIEKAVPEVLEALREDVLPPYRVAWENPGGFPPREFWELRPSFFSKDIAALAAEHPEAAYRRLVPLAKALAAWSDRFKLADEWCLEVALYTLNEWTHDPELCEREPDTFRLPSFGEAVPEGPERPDFRLPDWDPTLESWRAYETRAHQLFDVALAQYRDAGRTNFPFRPNLESSHGTQAGQERRSRHAGAATPQHLGREDAPEARRHPRWHA